MYLEDNVVTRIEGGREADQIRVFGLGGYYMRHALLGLNPKVRIAGGTQFEREKHAGAFYLGIDGLSDGKADPSQPGYAHVDCQMDRPTITVGGKPVVEHGNLLLLDDPEVREVAARYGSPGDLLDSIRRSCCRAATPASARRPRVGRRAASGVEGSQGRAPRAFAERAGRGRVRSGLERRRTGARGSAGGRPR